MFCELSGLVPRLLPWEPVPVSNHALGKNLSPDVQPKPPWLCFRLFHWVLSLVTTVNRSVPALLFPPRSMLKNTTRSPLSLLLPLYHWVPEEILSSLRLMFLWICHLLSPSLNGLFFHRTLWILLYWSTLYGFLFKPPLEANFFMGALKLWQDFIDNFGFSQKM